MRAIVGVPIKLNYRNAYEGGLQGPCTAEVIDSTVQPPELGTVKDGVFTASQEGSGVISSTFIYGDGTTNTYGLSFVASNPQTKEVIKEVQVPVPTPPKLIGGEVFDPDKGE